MAGGDGTVEGGFLKTFEVELMDLMSRRGHGAAGFDLLLQGSRGGGLGGGGSKVRSPPERGIGHSQPAESHSTPHQYLLWN